MLGRGLSFTVLNLSTLAVSLLISYMLCILGGPSAEHWVAGAVAGQRRRVRAADCADCAGASDRSGLVLRRVRVAWRGLGLGRASLVAGLVC